MNKKSSTWAAALLLAGAQAWGPQAPAEDPGRNCDELAAGGHAWSESSRGWRRFLRDGALGQGHRAGLRAERVQKATADTIPDASDRADALLFPARPRPLASRRLRRAEAARRQMQLRRASRWDRPSTRPGPGRGPAVQEQNTFARECAWNFRRERMLQVISSRSPRAAEFCREHLADQGELRRIRQAGLPADRRQAADREAAARRWRRCSPSRSPGSSA